METDTAPPAVAAGSRGPRLAAGTELLGEYQGSGFAEPKFLVARADGQVMQLPELLYRVVGSLDGRPVEQIAAELNAEFADQLDEEVTPEDVTAVIDGQLRPVGIIAPDPSEVAPGTGQQPVAAPVRADPLLALRYRIGVVPASVALRVSRILGPLFARPVWVVLLAAFVAVDVAILLPGDLVGRATAGVQDMIRMPVLVLAALALTVVASAFHEWGHITACRYGGATPGDVGVGLYIVWPAFYSTVTDSYRLDRRGRLRTDLGGVYFDAVLLAVLGLVYLRTGQPWLLVALIGLHVETAWQFLPSIRLDGYYILADLIGVPDLFGYVRAGLLSLVPGRPVPAKIAALKPRARRLVVLWVALVVPTLAAGAAAFLVALPRVVPAVVHSVAAYLDRLGGAARAGDVVVTTIGVIQLGLVLLPWIGTLLLLGSAGAAGCRWVAARSRIAPVPAVVRRAAVYAGALTALLAVGTALVARVLQVAETHPASAGELRLIDGAVAELHGVAPPPAAGLGDALARAELVGYARLAHPFARHADVVAAAREPAVVAVAVLVAALLALVVVGQLRPVAVAVPLLAVAATGPAVTALATAGPTLLGVACTALGATVVARTAGRVGVLLGASLVAAGVFLDPLISVVLAAAAGYLMVFPRRVPIAGPKPPAPRRGRWEPARLLPLLLVFPAGSLLVPATTRSGVALDGGERLVLLLLLGLCVGIGLLMSRSQPVAVAAGAGLALALAPWPGAPSALPVALTATVLVVALGIDTVLRLPARWAPHTLLRVAVAAPLIVLVVVGGLFLPATAPRLPHAQLAAWITGPASGAGAVSVSPALWGQLVADGVPPGRLRLDEGEPEGPAAGNPAWTVTSGQPQSAARGAVSFGAGASTLSVRPSLQAPSGTHG